MGQRSEKLGLTNDEVAFYDALGVNDSAVAVLGDEIRSLFWNKRKSFERTGRE